MNYTFTLLALLSLAFAATDASASASRHAREKNREIVLGHVKPGSEGTRVSGEADYTGAMETMHKNIPAATGDADVDFVAMMIPHHQAAVDMAEQEIKYGTDPRIRSLADDILIAQKREIKLMREWLDARKAATSATETKE